MLIKSLLSFLLLLASCVGYGQDPTTKTISMKGMSFSWNIETDTLHCSMQANTKGWLAVGFNTRDQLTGSNLIMARVENEKAYAEDQFILKPGVHPTDSQLGGSDHISNLLGKETEGKTIISFSIPLDSKDQYDHPLDSRQQIFVMLAYSIDDDFEHHSLLRRSFPITLN